MLASLMMMAQAALPLSVSAEAITVTARRFEQTRGILSKNVLTGRMRCRVTQTSGIAVLDKAVCDIAMACWQRKLASPEFSACVRDGRRQSLEAYLNRPRM